jgi:hypothetical protein
VFDNATGTEADERAHSLGRELTARLAQRALGGWDRQSGLQGVIKESVEFWLQPRARRVEQEGNQARQGQQAFARESCGRLASKSGERIRVKMLGQSGENGTGVAMSWSFTQRHCRT